MGMEFGARCDDGYDTCLAAMPLMFAPARVLVIAVVMAIVDGLRTEPLLACPSSGCQMGEQTGAPPTHKAAMERQCR